MKVRRENKQAGGLQNMEAREKKKIVSREETREPLEDVAEAPLRGCHSTRQSPSSDATEWQRHMQEGTGVFEPGVS